MKALYDREKIEITQWFEELMRLFFDIKLMASVVFEIVLEVAFIILYCELWFDTKTKQIGFLFNNEQHGYKVCNRAVKAGKFINYYNIDPNLKKMPVEQFPTDNGLFLVADKE